MGRTIDFKEYTDKKADGNNCNIRILHNPRLSEIYQEKCCDIDTLEDLQGFDDYEGMDDASIADHDSAGLETFKEWLRELGDGLVNTLEEFGLKDIDFIVEDESVARCLSGNCPGMFISYCGHSTVPGDNTEYKAILDLDDDGVETAVAVFVLRFNGSGASYFDQETKTWVDDKNLLEVHNILREGKGAAQFLLKFEDQTGMAVYLCDPQKIIDTLRKIQPVCKLYDLLDDVADFYIDWASLEEWDSLSEDETHDMDFPVGLLPDDVFREGSLIVYRNGRFAIYRYLDAYSLDAWNDEWPDKCSEEYLAEVYTEASIKKVAQTARMMWDHYSKDMVYCLPLSDSAYVEYRTYTEKLVTITKGGARKLTASEKTGLEEIKDILGDIMGR